MIDTFKISSTPTTTSITSKLESKIESDAEAFKEELEKKMSSKNEEELKEACDTMEHYMLTQIFKQMKASTKLGEGILEKGDYEKTFEDFYLQEITGQIVESGGIGLSKMMFENLKTSSI